MQQACLPFPGGDPALAATCRRLSLALPKGAALSHWTGAQLLGMWLPAVPSWLPAMATLPPGADRPERTGLYVARSRAGLPSPRLIEDLPVLAPELIIAQLAEDLRLIDLVVAMDSALSLGLCTLEQIEGSIRSRQRGLPVLREGLKLCDRRSESPWETILRLLHVMAGIAVEPQFLVRDGGGAVVARADLRIRGTRRLAEYDGSEHRDRTRHESDLARDKDLSRLRWERYGYIATEIVHHPGHIIRDAEDALGWRHDPQRMSEWQSLLPESTLSDDGKRRLLHRLHRYAKPLRGRGAGRDT